MVVHDKDEAPLLHIMHVCVYIYVRAQCADLIMSTTTKKCTTGSSRAVPIVPGLYPLCPLYLACTRCAHCTGRAPMYRACTGQGLQSPHHACNRLGIFLTAFERGRSVGVRVQMVGSQQFPLHGPCVALPLPLPAKPHGRLPPPPDCHPHQGCHPHHETSQQNPPCPCSLPGPRLSSRTKAVITAALSPVPGRSLLLQFSFFVHRRLSASPEKAT